MSSIGPVHAHSLENIPYLAQVPIFDEMTPSEIETFRKVCRSTRNQVQAYDDIVFGVTNIYRSFFPSAVDIENFRVLLARTGGIVSGSVLVKVLSRKDFQPADLDVFVRSCHAQMFGKFLLDIGFVFIPLATKIEGNRRCTIEQNPDFYLAVKAELSSWTPNTGNIADRYDNSALAGVFTFVHKEGGKIQIVATRTEPIDVILGFHSTAVMNIATATQIISLYPKTSFIDYKSLFLTSTSGSVTSARLKYCSRGWHPIDTITAVELLDYDCELSGKTRWVGDRHSWIINLAPLSEKDVDASAYDALFTTSWNVSCTGVDSARVVKSRLMSNLLSASYILTWEAEQAVRNHPCFSALKKQSTPINANTADADDTAQECRDIFEAELLEEEEEGSDGSSSEISELQYTIGIRLRVGLAGDVEIHDRYIADSEKMDQNILRLRRRFLSIPLMYPNLSSTVIMPTGHVATLILDCIQKVANASLSEGLKFNIRFEKRFDNGEHVVWTECILVVPVGELALLKQKVGNWSKTEFAYARLTVSLGSGVD
ncbi:hypothetical protein VNI00_017433 [Paramarasmius palmivorus]|uniref:F-box domain-containing protein n=1 Tax=Paramarasmius palmivorus TaxID=297713 RepID=A0AAW0B5F3_9AGAR